MAVVMAVVFAVVKKVLSVSFGKKAWRSHNSLSKAVVGGTLILACDLTVICVFSTANSYQYPLLGLGSRLASLLMYVQQPAPPSGGE